MNKFWGDFVRRVFIVVAIVAIAVIGWKIYQSPYRLGQWKSIIKYKKGAPPGTEIADPGAHPEINFAQLKSYRFFKGKGVPPEELKALEGQRVQLKGYILQPLRGDVVEDFQMVSDILTCCFGGKPLINAVVMCDLEEGKYFPYRVAAHRVTGELYMEPKRDKNGKVIKLYRMRVYEVERLKR